MKSQYLHGLTLERKSDNTISTYRFHIGKYEQWLAKNKLAIEQVTPRHLMLFKQDLLDEGLSDRSVNAITSCLRGYYDFMILNETVETNPVSTGLRIKTKSHKQHRLTDDQLVIFYSHIHTWPPNILAAFLLMRYTGARVGEVAELTKSDFSLHEGALYIDINDAKWGSDRKIPVTDAKAAKVIYDYIQSLELTGLPVFRVTKRTLQTYATGFQRITGISFSCHVLRHTFATILLEEGVKIEKIQFMLGHKSINVTRHYTQSADINVKGLAPSIWMGDPVR